MPDIVLLSFMLLCSQCFCLSGTAALSEYLHRRYGSIYRVDMERVMRVSGPMRDISGFEEGMGVKVEIPCVCFTIAGSGLILLKLSFGQPNHIK